MNTTHQIFIDASQSMRQIDSNSVIEWLREAREQGHEWADAAINNLDPDVESEEEISLNEALLRAFSWRTSPEKDKYWIKIHQALTTLGL